MSATTCGKRHRCPECGHDRSYSYAYDAFYCSECDKWLEPKCEMLGCIFCTGRHPTPSENKLCPRPTHADSVKQQS